MIDILNSMNSQNKIELPKAYQSQIDSSRILKSPCFGNGLNLNKIEHINHNQKSFPNIDELEHANSGLKIQN